MAALTPMKIHAKVQHLHYDDGRRVAIYAARLAQKNAPKLTGASAKKIVPVYGHNFFGVAWEDSYMWYQEQGIKPFTMTALSGKTIPMWIPDPTGTERQKNPKAQTRVTKSGVTQVLIFRKVGTKGDKKRKKNSDGTYRDVPNLNYPGAPGRIALRQAARPFTTPGKLGGTIAPGNVGVRWRHPGLSPRRFLLHGVQQAALAFHIIPDSIVAISEDGHQTALS